MADVFASTRNRAERRPARAGPLPYAFDGISQEPWLSANEDVPLDHGGPVDAPFERFEEFWLERPLIERFQGMVARYGDKIAVDDGVVCLTYNELLRASLHLAKRIAA